MALKMRKQIYIEPEQENLLKQLAQQAGLSEAELIRRALEQQSARGQSGCAHNSVDHDLVR